MCAADGCLDGRQCFTERPLLSRETRLHLFLQSLLGFEAEPEVALHVLVEHTNAQAQVAELLVDAAESLLDAVDSGAEAGLEPFECAIDHRELVVDRRDERVDLSFEPIKPIFHLDLRGRRRYIVSRLVALRWLPRPIGVAAGVTLRLTDRDDVLFAQPMPVDFEVVDVVRDRAQAISIAVLVAVAQQISAMARELATKANRQGDFQAAGEVLARAAAEIRALAPGRSELERIACELEEQGNHFTMAMSAVALKQAHFASHSERTNRDVRGRARRK